MLEKTHLRRCNALAIDEMKQRQRVLPLPAAETISEQANMEDSNQTENRPTVLTCGWASTHAHVAPL
jgi:hypothetical protein